MKITIVGTGYVGLSLAVLLSQKYEVFALDIDQNKIDKINNKISPIKDNILEKYLKEKNLNLLATNDVEKSYVQASFIIIAIPTDYDTKTGSFNTVGVEKVIAQILKFNDNTTIIIKSTIPLGFTEKMRKRFNTNKIIYSPEFLRENKALYDNLYPSRIIVGDTTFEAEQFGRILVEVSDLTPDKITIFKMSSSEAEAVKLFANTYLAMRISFFNELDSYSEYNNLNTEKIINGICADPRIGNYYNNPSFGYGGYCLPKDTKQLLDNFSDVPNNIIKAVVESNKTRKNFIVKSILNQNPKIVGVHRLIMKENSDNFRDSAIIDIFEMLRSQDIDIIIYEPLIDEDFFNGLKIIRSIDEFVKKSDLIIANRLTSDLKLFENKVYTRDVFNEN
jgi:UDPglucose 6-dehydrogenase